MAGKALRNRLEPAARATAPEVGEGGWLADELGSFARLGNKVTEVATGDLFEVVDSPIVGQVDLRNVITRAEIRVSGSSTGYVPATGEGVRAGLMTAGDAALDALLDGEPAEDAADSAAFVADYGPNGEPMDFPVEPPAKGQGELFPELAAKDDLWPRFDGYRIGSVRLAFAGGCDLATDAVGLELATRVARIGEKIRVTIEGEVLGRNFKHNAKSGRVDGVATVVVSSVVLAGEKVHFSEWIEGQVAEGGIDSMTIKDDSGDLVSVNSEEAAFFEPVPDFDGQTERDSGPASEPTELDKALEEAFA